MWAMKEEGQRLNSRHVSGQLRAVLGTQDSWLLRGVAHVDA